MKKSLIKPVFIVFILLALSSIAIITQYSWKNDYGSPKTIGGDGLGYYQYLTSYFIYDNLDKLDSNKTYNVSISGKVVNKCYVGTALLMSPFFGMACLHTTIKYEELKPLATRFQKWMSVSGLFYLLWGLIFTFKFLRYYQISITNSLIAVCLLLFGTNLLHYALVNPSMSHVYSFFTIAAFCYLLKKYFLNFNSFNLYAAILFLTLTAFIRPTNGIIVLIVPLLLSEKQSIGGIIKKLSIVNYVVSIAIVCLFFMIQAYVWYLQIGEWMVWSYNNEGFNFLHPEIIEVLVGFRKGWIIYTPLVAVSFIGFYSLYKKNKRHFFTLLFLFILMIYIVSSWWNWYYGPSLSQRPFVDFYILIAFLLGTLLDALNSIRIKIFVLLVCCLCVGLNLVYTYQYKANIISSWDMNFEKYKATFLVFDAGKAKIGGYEDIEPYKAYKLLVYEHYQNDAASVNEENDSIVNAAGQLYLLTTRVDLDSSFISESGLQLRGSITRLELKQNSSEEAKIIVDITDQETKQRSYYSGFYINETPSTTINEWKTTRFVMNLPKLSSTSETVTIYVLNEGQKEVLIKNFDWRILKY